jgi:hypothetical protein
MMLEGNMILAYRLTIKVEKGSDRIETVFKSENIHNFVEVFLGYNLEVHDILCIKFLCKCVKRRGEKPFFIWVYVSDVLNDFECSNGLLCLVAQRE